MKLNDVPQDKSNLESAGFKELCYGVDEEGNYGTKTSSGWNPKKIALDQSLEYINERIAGFKQRAQAKEISPIQYYMELNRMDLIVLSDYVGKWQWQVKRHFKINVFNSLSSKMLKKYAAVFNVSVAQLKEIDK